jgi:hypothetical protein
LQSDVLHCGDCGTACENDEVCDAGECVCPPDKTDCDGVCVDLETDADHCGDCETECENNKICADAECTCPAGQDECDGTCVDLTNDPQYCGDCETRCPNNLSCIDSHCGCPQGQTDCSRSCVSLTTDAANCGFCGQACEEGFSCFNGQCIASPCDRICNDPESAVLAEDGFRMEPLGLSSHCYEVKGYDPSETTRRIVCWEFQAGRTLRVNGSPMQCLTDDGTLLGPPRAGGYCIQVGAGGANFAGLLLPTR